MSAPLPAADAPIPEQLAEQLEHFVRAAQDPALALQCFGSYAARIGVYANNTLFNRADALAEAFPTILQLVGEDFFGGMARVYARQHASQSGDLNRYGAAFADFIAGFPPAAELPYLADCARLDWLLHCAYYADDAPPFDFARLAELAAAGETDLRFVAHPAASVVESPWPIVRLWQAHQAQGGEFPALENGGDAALLTRGTDRRPKVRLLAPAEFAFAGQLLAGATLDASLQAGLQKDEMFLPGPSLNALIGDQAIINCYRTEKT